MPCCCLITSLASYLIASELNQQHHIHSPTHQKGEEEEVEEKQFPFKEAGLSCTTYPHILMAKTQSHEGTQ
jgi:hypothetical protein